MSIREFRQLAKARAIVKDELSKIKLQDEKVNPALVQVEYAVQLSDAQFEDEKNILRSNLNKVMTLQQASEIVNDSDIITKENIFVLNRSWDRFIQGVSKEFSNLTFDTFKTVLKTYLRRLAEPNDEQAQINRLSDIIDILEYQSMTINGLAPKVEQIKQILREKYISPDEAQTIKDGLESGEIGTEDLLKGLQQDLPFFPGAEEEGQNMEEEEDFRTPEAGPSRRASIAETMYFPSNYHRRVIGSASRQELENIYAKLKNSQKVKQALDFVIKDGGERDAVVQELKNQLGDSLPERNRDFLRTIDPWVVKFKNFKAQEVVNKSGNTMSAVEAKKEAEKASKAIFGFGIKKDNRTKKETTVSFGVLQLNIDKLKQNKLKLTYNNGNMVKEIKLTDISDKFKSMVQDILNKSKFSEAKFNKLSDDEKLMYKLMIKKARVAGDIDVRLDTLGTPSIDKLKNEWEVINGQIMAGNNNPALSKRAKEIIQEFINKKIITKSQGVEILMNL